MSRVRSTGNASTELLTEAFLTRKGIDGWVKHPREVPGHPDFFFPDYNLALFVDGCFWHACPKCGRLPKSRTDFWRAKIEENRLRDQRIRKALRRQGVHVMRVWEHQVRGQEWMGRLLRMLHRIPRQNTKGSGFNHAD